MNSCVKFIPSAIVITLPSSPVTVVLELDPLAARLELLNLELNVFRLVLRHAALQL